MEDQLGTYQAVQQIPEQEQQSNQAPMTSNNILGSIILSDLSDSAKENPSNYRFIQKLTQNNQHRIYLVEYLPTSQHFVMKLFILPSSASLQQHAASKVNYQTQVACLRALQGTSNCLQFYAKVENVLNKFNAIVVHLCAGGDLLCHIFRMTIIPEDSIRGFLHQLVSILEQLQSKKLAHLNIRPENLLFDDQFNLVLSGFGMCQTLGGEVNERISRYSSSQLSSSPYYHLPETMQGMPFNAYQADIFAVGMTLFTLFAQSDMFKQPQTYQILCKSTDMFWKAAKTSAINPAFVQGVSSEFKDLFVSMVHPMPTKRITLEQIKMHPFYNNVANLSSPSSGSSSSGAAGSGGTVNMRQMNEYNSTFQVSSMGVMGTIATHLTRGCQAMTINEQFEMYEYSVANLMRERQVKVHEAASSRLSDFRTDVDCQTLFKYLFIRQEEYSAEVPILSDMYYKMVCVYGKKNHSHSEELVDRKKDECERLKFSIHLKQDASRTVTYVLFKREEGSEIEFFEHQARILAIIRKFN